MSSSTFPEYYKNLVENGYPVQTRIGPAKMLLNQQVEFEPGQMFRRPKDNPSIGFCEGLQFIGQTGQRDAIKAVAPNVDISLFGANSFYGPRVGKQILNAIELLKVQRADRRAVIMIARDHEPPANLPCTLSVQFNLLNGGLYSTFNMRSSDAIWGLPYDMIQFGMVARAVASCLDARPATAIINIANAHVYENTEVPVSVWTEERFNLPRLFNDWISWSDWAYDIVKKNLDRKEVASLFK